MKEMSKERNEEKTVLKDAPDIRKLAWDVDEPTYRSDHAFSYSTLARYAKEGFSKIDELYRHEETPSLLFGSMVDALVTGSEEEFEAKYARDSSADITWTQRTATKELYETHREAETMFDIPEEELKEVQMRNGLWHNGYKDSTNTSKFLSQCCGYFDMLKRTGDKVLVTAQDYDDALACYGAISDSPAAALMLNRPADWFFGKEVHHQLKFRMTDEETGIDFRAMLDSVVVDHKTKEITPADLKTSSGREYMFPAAFVKWKYYIQGELYRHILKTKVESCPEFNGYTVKNFTFVVVNRESRTPLIWEYDCRHADWMEDWRELAKSLSEQITYGTELPIGVSQDCYNSITGFLDKEGRCTIK